MVKRFKLWSEVSPSSKEKLLPHMALRAWDDLSKDERQKFYKHLTKNEWIETDLDNVVRAVYSLNDMYKVNVYGHALFEHGTLHWNQISESYESCCRRDASSDFVRIITDEKHEVVMELFSLYAQKLTYAKWQSTSKLERFCNAFNEVSDQFGLNVRFTSHGPMPKQELIVDELVVDPIFEGLSGDKWNPVQSEFTSAVSEYRKGKSSAYSASITHTVNSVQAYLQVLVHGKTGKGSISSLVKVAVARGIIPANQLSNVIIPQLQSLLMQYRQMYGNAHPKQNAAEEKDARLILNTAAVFIQYCIDYAQPAIEDSN